MGEVQDKVLFSRLAQLIQQRRALLGGQPGPEHVKPRGGLPFEIAQRLEDFGPGIEARAKDVFQLVERIGLHMLRLQGEAGGVLDSNEATRRGAWQRRPG